MKMQKFIKIIKNVPQLKLHQRWIGKYSKGQVLPVGYYLPLNYCTAGYLVKQGLAEWYESPNESPPSPNRYRAMFLPKLSRPSQELRGYHRKSKKPFSPEFMIF